MYLKYYVSGSGYAKSENMEVPILHQVHRTRNDSSKICRQNVAFLAVLWTSGLIIGFLLGRLLGKDAYLLFVYSVKKPLKIAGMAVRLLPIAVLILFYVIRKHWMLFTFAFVYALCSGVTVFFVATVFKSAAWLIYFLLCFSGIFSSIAMLWLILRLFNSNKYSYKNELWIAGIFVTLLSFADYTYISPFLISLLDLR